MINVIYSVNRLEKNSSETKGETIVKTLVGEFNQMMVIRSSLFCRLLIAFLMLMTLY